MSIAAICKSKRRATEQRIEAALETYENGLEIPVGIEKIFFNSF